MHSAGAGARPFADDEDPPPSRGRIHVDRPPRLLGRRVQRRAPPGRHLVAAAGADVRALQDVLARAGVKVLLYEGEYFHSKTVCIDSIICSIGSANMDIRSFSINYETNLVVYDQTLTRELEADFEADLERCVRFSVEEYEARRRTARIIDSTLRLCSPLL